MIRKNTIYAVGLGPGDQMMLTPQAQSVIEGVDVVVGYTLYIDLITSLCEGKKIHSTGMMKEIDRCSLAIEEACNGASVAVVCSGDSSVYGMASLLFELSANKGDCVAIEVIPGITAALSVGAELGSPLSNDFSVISLSNLLTPEEIILKRLHSAAQGDMTTVLYNPRSKKRTLLIQEAQRIFTAANPECSLVAGFVKNAGRDKKEIWIGTLETLPIESIDMLTTVIIGNSQTEILSGKMVTHRGYHRKYTL